MDVYQINLTSRLFTYNLMGNGSSSGTKTIGIKNDVSVVLTDLKYDKSLGLSDLSSGTVSIPAESETNANPSTHRKKNHTCYTCMAKFSTLEDLQVHKYIHSDSDTEDDLFIENYYFSNAYEGNIYSVEDAHKKSSCSVVKDPKEVQPTVEKGSKEVQPTVEKESTKEEPNSIETINNNKEVSINVEVESPSENSNENPEKSMIFKNMRFRCSTCKVDFKHNDEYTSHNPRNGRCKLYCCYCRRSFKIISRFSDHILEHSTAQITPESLHKCSKCTFKFHSILRLKRHERKIHEKGRLIKLSVNKETKTNDLTCELCYDVFQNKNLLKVHMAFHEELEKSSDVNTKKEIKNKDNVSTTMTPNNQNLTENIGTETLLLNGQIILANDYNSTVEDNNEHLVSNTPSITPITKESLNINRNVDAAQNRMHHSSLVENVCLIQKPTVENNSLEVQKTGPFSFSVNYKNASLSKQRKRKLPFKGNRTHLPILPKPTESNQNTELIRKETKIKKPPSKKAKSTLPSAVSLTHLKNIKLQKKVVNQPSAESLQKETPLKLGRNYPIDQIAYVTTSLPDICILPASANKTPAASSTKPNISSKDADVSPTQTNLSSNSVPTTTKENRLTSLSGGTVTTSCASKNLAESLIKDSELRPKKISPNNALGAKKETLKSFGIYFEEPILIDDSDDDDGSATKKKEPQKASISSDFQKYLETYDKRISANTGKVFIAKCDSCSQVFYENGAVIEHSQKRLTCKDCKQKFCLLADLRMHYLEIHKKYLCCTCQFLAKGLRDYCEHTKNGICTMYENSSATLILSKTDIK